MGNKMIAVICEKLLSSPIHHNYCIQMCFSNIRCNFRAISLFETVCIIDILLWLNAKIEWIY